MYRKDIELFVAVMIYEKYKFICFVVSYTFGKIIMLRYSTALQQFTFHALNSSTLRRLPS